MGVPGGPALTQRRSGCRGRGEHACACVHAVHASVRAEQPPFPPHCPVSACTARGRACACPHSKGACMLGCAWATLIVVSSMRMHAWDGCAAAVLLHSAQAATRQAAARGACVHVRAHACMHTSMHAHTHARTLACTPAHAHAP